MNSRERAGAGHVGFTVHASSLLSSTLIHNTCTITVQEEEIKKVSWSSVKAHVSLLLHGMTVAS